MLNLVTYNIEDQQLLEDSYNTLKNKEQVTIVTDKAEKEKIFQQTCQNIEHPFGASFSFQNLFKQTTTKGTFYIAQCLVDFGYEKGSKGGQSFREKYHYQLIGIANMRINLGNTHLKPETKLDKFFSRFFIDDIDFSGAELFNHKYLLVSDKRDAIISHFNKPFLNTIARYDAVYLKTKGTEMYLSFADELQTPHAAIVQDVFCSFDYLEK